MAISSRAKTPINWSISGYFSSSASLSRSARQPATITRRSRPRCFSRSISSIVPYDSARASPMKPQVLIDHQLGAVRLGNHPVAVQLQQPGHPLAIDEVLGTAEADQGVGAGGVSWWARTRLVYAASCTRRFDRGAVFDNDP